MCETFGGVNRLQLNANSQNRLTLWCVWGRCLLAYKGAMLQQKKVLYIEGGPRADPYKWSYENPYYIWPKIDGIPLGLFHPYK